MVILAGEPKCQLSPNPIPFIHGAAPWNVMTAKEEQLEKAQSPIYLTLFGIAMTFSDSQ